jgi:hypothetical protein
MLEPVSDTMILTLDSDIRIYPRHGRQKVPVLMPATL